MRIICLGIATLLAGTAAALCASAAPQETVLYSFDTVGGGFPDGDLVVE